MVKEIWEKQEAEAKAGKKPDAKFEPKVTATDFTSVKNLENEIQDIIGVRVTLYFPSQVQETVKRLETIFSRATNDVDIKEINDSKTALTKHDLSNMFTKERAFLQMNTQLTLVEPVPDKYEPKYGNYRAVHLRFELSTVDLGTRLQRDLGERRLKVEVQIQSLLMHAWSEVNHDIVYKTLSGEISPSETYLLDLLRGIGKMGEAVLLELKQIMEDRMKKEASGNSITTIHELAELVRGQVKQETDAKNPYSIGDVEDLLKFLVSVGKTDRTKVTDELSKWKETGKHDVTVANSIMVQVMRSGNREWVEQSFHQFRPFLLQAQNSDYFAAKATPADKDSWEELAAIIAFACRSYLKALGAKADKSLPPLVSYAKLLEKGMYQNEVSAMPRMAYKINGKVAKDANIQALLTETAEELAKTKSPELASYLRHARIRTWDNVNREKKA